MPGYDPTDDEVPDYDRPRGEGAAGGVLSRVRRRAGNGTLALLAGGVMLARAARAMAQSRRRAAVRAVAGVGLLVIGMRQRRSGEPDRLAADEAGTDTPDVTFPEGPDEVPGGSESGGDDEDGVQIDITESHVERDDEDGGEQPAADSGADDSEFDFGEESDEERADDESDAADDEGTESNDEDGATADDEAADAPDDDEST